MNPYQAVDDFEKAVAAYTGAPFCAATNSCTNAVLLCLLWLKAKGELPEAIELPRYTYVSIPQQVLWVGAKLSWRDELWTGCYRLKPTMIWDSARRFTSGMYRGGFMALSFHASKTLGIEFGGAILCDDPKADAWFRKARFDGRTPGVSPKNDVFDVVGLHCMMAPSMAAQGLLKLFSLPKDNPDLPWSDYPDLSQIPLFGGAP